MVRHHGAEDNTLGPDDCKAYGAGARAGTMRYDRVGRRWFQSPLRPSGVPHLCAANPLARIAEPTIAL